MRLAAASHGVRGFRVASAPTDSGLVLGALFGVSEPSSAFSVFLGLPLDAPAHELQHDAARLGAVAASPGAVAAKLSAARHGAVGVLRGRAEVGPRQLGHRAALALASHGGALAACRAKTRGHACTRRLYTGVRAALR